MDRTIAEDIAERRAEADRLERLSASYPDLRRVRGRWQEFLVSKAVNATATECEIRHTCGCCADAPLVVRPFVSVGRDRIYADPYEVRVGEGVPFRGGDRPYEDWRERVAEAGYSEAVAASVAAYLGTYDPGDDDD